MYCPKCATENSDDTRFCRACGANLSLVPQALTGHLSGSRHTRRRNRHGSDDEEPSLANGIQKVFIGIGFILVSIAVNFFAPAGRIWWFWLLIPAFASLGKGVAEILTAKNTAMPPATNQAAMPPARNTNDLPPRPMFDTLQPPSVTEGTTRHLDPAKDSYNDRR